MMTMEERIEALLKVRKERPEEHSLWRTHYNQLLNLHIPDDIKQALREAWNEIELKEGLSKWDSSFTEAVINGANELITISTGTTPKAALGQLATTAEHAYAYNQQNAMAMKHTALEQQLKEYIQKMEIEKIKMYERSDAAYKTLGGI